MITTQPGPDGRPRCSWCLSTPEYLAYHDTEWGFPVTDDRRLFEKLCLEGFQSGLSWRTILMKRENFRKTFGGFDYRKVATYTEADVQRLLLDAGIVRHRGKIEAVINNAQRMIELVKKRGWKFVGPTTVYAFMQAMGLVNDHAIDCVTRQAVANLGKENRK